MNTEDTEGQDQALTPPAPSDPRFSLELEFVLSLGNPLYISHLAVAYPYLLGTRDQEAFIKDADNDGEGEANDQISENDQASSSRSEQQSTDAAAFAAYLKYLYDYWRRPEYMQFLTHPEATLKGLRVLQEEAVRKTVIRPGVIEQMMGRHNASG
ncbi:suppressor of hpr1 [Ascosphaera aggregata]|nr:suppressor of hpr1 [Ascosphaera aggregata]